jgi:hypothetical protein
MWTIDAGGGRWVTAPKARRGLEIEGTARPRGSGWERQRFMAHAIADLGRAECGKKEGGLPNCSQARGGAADGRPRFL